MTNRSHSEHPLTQDERASTKAGRDYALAQRTAGRVLSLLFNEENNFVF